MNQKLTRKELKTLTDVLGKNGFTMAEHEEAYNAPHDDMVFVEVDCFVFEPTEQQRARGWQVGYGVQYNGVGIAAAPRPADPEGNEAGEAPEPASDTESSGFDSDPPTDDEELESIESRRTSDDVSDRGQLLYGVDNQFYVDKACAPVDVKVWDMENTADYKTRELVTTMRFEVANSSGTADDEFPNGYQMIGNGNIPGGDSDDSDDEVAESFENVTTNAGLWCNFVISPKDLELPVKPEKLEISEEKLKTIPLDSEKLAQISAAMANFKLPTPPGWEGVSDKKILDFINQRI